jgi:outer membrane lipoprotein carrier protein
MKAKVLALSLLLGVAAPMALPSPRAEAQAAQSPSASQIADNVQNFYNKTRTFKASFRQRYTIRAYNKQKNSQGTVIFEKPGKMSWRYTSNNNRVVSDGKTIKIYEADNKQMFVQPMDKSQYPAALAFLVGGGNLKKSFKLVKLNSQQLHFPGGYVLEGIPKNPTPAYQKVLLYVDAATSQVRRMILLDAQGNLNRFDFIQPSVNVKVPPGEFKFDPPPGTQIIHP